MLKARIIITCMLPQLKLSASVRLPAASCSLGCTHSWLQGGSPRGRPELPTTSHQHRQRRTVTLGADVLTR